MADGIERVHYFEKQFLHAVDFTAEQDYHRALRRFHNIGLHTPGVASGLGVAGNGTAVTVTPGVALDSLGRDIVLTDKQELDLTALLDAGGGYITIAFREEPTRELSENGVQGHTRWAETPLLETSASAPEGPDKLLLAHVVRDESGQLKIDESVRRRAGAIEGDVNLTAQDPKVGDKGAVRLAWFAPNAAALEGSLRIRAGGDSAGFLGVEGGATVGSGLGVTGGVVVDAGDTFAGAIGPAAAALSFGATGKEGIGSRRTAGANRYGLDLFTNSAARLSVTAAGNVGIGIQAPTQRLQVAGGNAVLNNAFLGDVGLGAAWAGFSHSSVAAAASYGLAQSSDGRTTQINKKSGGGRIAFRVDNADRLAMDDTGHVGLDLANLNAGALAPGLAFGTAGTEGIASRRTAGGNQSGLDLYTAGVSRLSVTNAGRVGIGTQTPGQRLEVAGNAVANGAFVGDAGLGAGWAGFAHAQAVGATSYALMQSADGLNTYVNKKGGGGQIALRIDNVDRLVVMDDGDVGIGTSAPARRLHVEPSEVHVGGSSAGYSFGNRETSAFVETPAAGERWEWYASAGTARLWSNGDKLAVTPAGNVGIGTISPSQRLHVAANAQVNNMLLGDVGHGAAWMGFGHTGSVSTTGYSVIQDSTGRYTLINKRSGGGFINFRVDNVDRIWITDAGWMGIGAVPSYPLQVAGNAWIQGTVWANAFWAGGVKGGYVGDQFVNNLGETLEEGDVVVVGSNQASLYYGHSDQIPIPEVDLADRAYDTRVCGIVSEVHAEVVQGNGAGERGPGTARALAPAKRGAAPAETRLFEPGELAELDRTKVAPGQVGWVVTLGAYARCKVDADLGAIEVGDLLTTSPTKGHAQKVTDPNQAAGAILGKALAPLEKGKGTIPVMVMLQ